MPEIIPHSLPANLLLRTVLRVLQAAIQLLRPLYAAEGGELTDFALTRSRNAWQAWWSSRA